MQGIRWGHQATETATVAAQQHSMELWISYVLRAGVLVSAAIILVGGVIFVLRGPGPSDPHSMSQLLKNDYANRDSLAAILRGLRRGRGTAYVDVGLLVLILTPVLRVGMTVLLFLREKDWVFVAITSVVLLILILGVSGKAF